jgi:hypothetical protein
LEENFNDIELILFVVSVHFHNTLESMVRVCKAGGLMCPKENAELFFG